MKLLRPLTARSTYRGWAWLILGGAMLMPYMMAGEVVRISVFGVPANLGVVPGLDPAVFVAVVPVVAATALALPVRALSVSAATALLGARIAAVAGPRGWSRRWRDATWFTVHVVSGGLLSGVTLALTPFVVLVMLLPFVSGLQSPSQQLLDAGWRLWWGPAFGPLALAGLVYAVWATNVLLRRWAPRLLGPTPTERLAASRAEAARLAGRNRVARELHDSVGHALSVMTMQAAAAGRVIDADVEFARNALSTVEETGRRALAELDQMLAVLRADGAAGSGHGLPQLPQLLATCGVHVESHVDVDVASLPQAVSQEAYRIVQEALTNVLRYGADSTAQLRVVGDSDTLHLEVSNRIPSHAPAQRRGRGVAGMVERAAALGGQLHAGAHHGQWKVAATLPLTSPL